MAAKSKNKYDVYEWIRSIIKSCKDWRQLTTANKLIRFFYATYGDLELRRNLSCIWQVHLSKLSEKQK